MQFYLLIIMLSKYYKFNITNQNILWIGCEQLTAVDISVW